MEKKDLQLRRSNLPYPYKLKTQRSYLIIALVGIFLIAHLHKDSVLQILLLTILGVTLPLFTLKMKWRIQIIEICLKEGKRLSFKNLRATKAGKKSLNFLLIFFGIYLMTVALGLIFPEKMSSFALREFSFKMIREIANFAAPYESSPLPISMPSRTYKLLTFADVILGTMYYLLGGIIGAYMPIYLWARKLPK